MKQLLKKVGILSAVFIIAIAVYFVWSQKSTEKNHTMVYTSMEEASLPVVYTKMYGRNINLLHGYMKDMQEAVTRDALTILPSDRSMNIEISDYNGSILGISYEVRSLDLKRLVERTSVDKWNEEEDSVNASLPIQNLLTKDQEYLLILSLDTSEHGKLYYYTRIMWTDNPNVEQMVDFAFDFTTRTFDYDQARELTTYLETNDTADNSSLGNVNIHSSFSQLTWAGLPVKQVGEIRATLKDMNGIMCNIQLEYEVSCLGEYGEDTYEVTDDFTLKWDARRIYLMDFERKTNQIFTGQKELFSGKKILLGITNKDDIRTAKSPSGNYVSFVVNRDLWSYDQEHKHAVKVFSFRSGNDVGLRGSYNQHDIKILSVSDNGDVNFLVYGYMSRGIHEGSMGIAMYQYRSQDNAIEEHFFTPVTQSFEIIKEEVSQLAHLGANGMLYLMADRAVYGIDLNSNEYMLLADSLIEGGYAVSDSQRHFAWQEGDDLYGAKVIHLMDLDTGEKREISGGDNDCYRPLGFVGDDFIYGISREGDLWVQNGRIKDGPLYRIEIMGQNGKIVKEYEHDDMYISNVSVEDSRIHLTQVIKTDEQSYVASKQDTIVCNKEIKNEEMNGIGWYASKERRKLYFVQLDKEISGNSVKVSVPKKVAYDTTEVVELKTNTRILEHRFYAYGGGHYLGSGRDFTDALKLAYEEMGVVTNQDKEILWNRVNRPLTKNIKYPLKTGSAFLRNLRGFDGSESVDEGVLLLDARDCTLRQILYFVGRGCPVAAYTEEGGYQLISGYDQYNVTLYNPVTGETKKMGLNDASSYFESQGNDFVCGVFME